MLPKQYKVACHTDNVGPGTTFVAIKGDRYNGVDFINLALERGACAIVVQSDQVLEQSVLDVIAHVNARLIRVNNARRCLAQLAAQAYNFPADKLAIYAVTGTKGKTTTCFLLEHILSINGLKTALITSEYNKINGVAFATTLTTPQPDYLHSFFDVCLQQGVTHVVMEVAAQALSLDRVYGITFSSIIFTNFDQEHGEFYATMQDYFAAKCAIFDHTPNNAPCFLNMDDAWITSITTKNTINYFFSLKNNRADCYATVQYTVNAGIVVSAQYNNNVFTFSCPALIGLFNAYNLLAVIAFCLQHAFDLRVIQNALQTFNGIPGRMEKYILTNGATCYIDKAHNPSSYRALLSTLRPLTKHLIVVFGAGGNRDRAKRPLMGTIVAQYADTIILTNDNPRTENPQSIIDDIMRGIPSDMYYKVIIEYDRQLAIHKAYASSTSNAIIVLLGKGNEEYQEIGTAKIPFSEKQILATLL